MSPMEQLNIDLYCFAFNYTAFHVALPNNGLGFYDHLIDFQVLIPNALPEIQNKSNINQDVEMNLRDKSINWVIHGRNLKFRDSVFNFLQTTRALRQADISRWENP